MYSRFLATVAAASLMTGCAIHPVPEDVTGLRTEDIVKQVRCETRDAARQVIRDFLKRIATEQEDPTALRLYEKYSADPDLMRDFQPDTEFRGSFYENTRAVFKLIYGAGAAYTFDLTMDEKNNIGSSTTFLGTWSTVLNMTLGADLNRKRQNRRTFTITDNFANLLGPLNYPGIGDTKSYCDGHISLGPNYIYPIAGKIGMFNTVRTFLQLSIFENLGPNEKVGFGAKGAPAMVEELTFTTMVDLQPTPKFTFIRLNRGFEVLDTTPKGDFAREDKHQLTVGLAIEGAGVAPLADLRNDIFPGRPLPGGGVRNSSKASDLPLVSIIAAPKTRSEFIAAYAVDQRKRSEIQLRPAP